MVSDRDEILSQVVELGTDGKWYEITHGISRVMGVERYVSYREVDKPS